MKDASQSLDIARSQLSQLPPKKIRDLPRVFLLDQLEQYYGARPPAEAVECDYALWECAETGLQFAWPPTPGNLRFYEWISGFTSYYPGIRWEYREVRRLIAPKKPDDLKSFRLLDVGCGKGDFLRSLDFIPVENRYALDLNEPAVATCRQQGFQAYCGTMDGALAGGFIKAGSFPVVTSFHCLEHVDQPVEFVRSLVGAVAPGGRLFISTPYSPMSFEADWFDILNHPPHHMTRWNLRAYKHLADLTGTKMKYYTPPASPLKRAVRNFRLLQYGPHSSVGRATLLKDILRHLSTFMKNYQRQRQRQPVGADVILVEFTIS